MGLAGIAVPVAVFGRAMKRHGIIVVAASALATAGHRDGGKLTQGEGGGGRSLRTAFANIVVADAILARWREEDAARLFSWVETCGVARGGPRGPRGPLLRDRFRLAAAAMMTMTGDDDDNGGGHRGQRQQSTISGSGRNGGGGDGGQW